nr:immunoglobulin heavy chain junction region [Macaca mulatta]MOY22263.1 immunoglobulin heavy chain junction region [Macaca mulatta]MOY22680.1 immunoglobulin heavy chain junction region [Macaca mulatta]MOY22897.1 immunoglobulin heavy chain junction region [Macaca mulatta]MOY22939.1 immunoglobulin heavy chain junction region [Macaca mulatta]
CARDWGEYPLGYW